MKTGLCPECKVITVLTDKGMCSACGNAVGITNVQLLAEGSSDAKRISKTTDEQIVWLRDRFGHRPNSTSQVNSPATLTCVWCGRDLHPGDTYCPSCGKPGDIAPEDACLLYTSDAADE